MDDNTLLITKLRRRQDDRVDLFGRGHKWPDLLLHDITDLRDVDIAFEDLLIGVETPCRFVAHFVESEKQKSTGNPYLDVTYLERINGHVPATSVDVDSSAILAELRAIHAELQRSNALLAQVLHIAPEDLPTDDVGSEPPAPEDLSETPDEPDGVPGDESPGPTAPRPLNDDQARRLATKQIGSAVREEQITPAQANELTSMGRVKGWREALGALETLLELTIEEAM